MLLRVLVLCAVMGLMQAAPTSEIIGGGDGVLGGIVNKLNETLNEFVKVNDEVRDRVLLPEARLLVAEFVQNITEAVKALKLEQEETSSDESTTSEESTTAASSSGVEEVAASRLVGENLADVLNQTVVALHKRALDIETAGLERLCATSSGVGASRQQNDFKYFQAYPGDESRYVKCDPWGNWTVHECESGSVWDSWKLTCVLASERRNSTAFDWSFLQKQPKQEGGEERQGMEKGHHHRLPLVFNCNLPQFTCLNEGVCEQVQGDWRCTCSGNYTGEICDIVVQQDTLYADIMSGNFSIVRYRNTVLGLEQQWTVLNDNISFYEQYKPILGERVWTELANYLAQYNGTRVRYDRTVHHLVEDLLEEIYPDAFYLSVFNASSETVLSIVRIIPNLLSYAKYSSERYEQVFLQYQRILDRLVPELNASWPLVRQEAQDYSRFVETYVNTTQQLIQQQEEKQQRQSLLSEESRLSEQQVRERLQTEYNQTLNYTQQLFTRLERFQERAVEQLRINPEWSNITLGALDLAGCKETIELFDQVRQSSLVIWESLVSYGFWYLTNAFVLGPQAPLTQQERV